VKKFLRRGIQLRSPSPVAAHRQVLLEEGVVVAVVLRRILWRGPARRNQTLHRAAGDTAIVVAYPGLMSGACATHWGVNMSVWESIEALHNFVYKPNRISRPPEVVRKDGQAPATAFGGSRPTATVGRWPTGSGWNTTRNMAQPRIPSGFHSTSRNLRTKVSTRSSTEPPLHPVTKRAANAKIGP
jgi:hypothetical protein